MTGNIDDPRLKDGRLLMLYVSGAIGAQQRVAAIIRRKAEGAEPPLISRNYRTKVTSDDSLLVAVAVVSESDVDRLVEPFKDVEIKAELRDLEATTMRVARYEGGMRIGGWRSEHPRGVLMGVVVTGEPEDVVAFYDAMAFAERGDQLRHPVFERDVVYGVLRHFSEDRDGCALSFSVASRDRVEIVAKRLAAAFPNVTFEFGCASRDGTVLAARFSNGSIARAWSEHRVDLDPGLEHHDIDESRKNGGRS